MTVTASRVRPKLAVIAEDEPRVQMLVRTCLQMDGWTVHSADNGADAAALVAEHDPVLVVLDIMMPGTDGRVGCEMIRANDGDMESRVIVMLTALSEEGDVIEGVMSGADDYITKPFDADDLSSRCERFVTEAGWELGD
jgi:DNA-binding response OmpR family regulator